MDTIEGVTRVREWGGRRAQRLVRQTLHDKGDVCVLCGMAGSDSADHNPPRSVLVAMGVEDPDAPEFLFPAHLRPCNISRQARPITTELRLELRAKRLALLERVTHRATGLSPRFARRAPVLLRNGRPDTPRYDRAEGPIAEPCRHRVEVTVWPTRIDLEEPA